MKKQERLQKRADKLGMSVDELKQSRKDAMNRGLKYALTGEDTGPGDAAKKALNAQMKEEKLEDDKKVLKDTAGVGTKDTESGGGQLISQDTIDRSSTTDNAVKLFMRKKGYE